MNVYQFLELHELNRKWFEANEHLTNEEMLAAGLINACDLVWVDKLRGEAQSLAEYFETESQIAKVLTKVLKQK